MNLRPSQLIAESGVGSSAYYDQCAKGLRTKPRPHSPRCSLKRQSVHEVENFAFAAGLTDESKRQLVVILDHLVDAAASDDEVLATGREFIAKAEKTGARAFARPA